MPGDVRVVVETAADGGFAAVTEDGVELRIDVSPAAGGRPDAWLPTQLLLAALGGCLAIDVVGVLRKKRQEPGRYRIIVRGERSEEPGRPFVRLEAEHSWDGPVTPDIVEDVVRLVDERYCTIALTLRRKPEIAQVVSPLGESSRPAD